MAVFLLIAVMMEAAGASGVFGNFCQTARQCNPEDSRIQDVSCYPSIYA
jgi:hypothetical protein